MNAITIAKAATISAFVGGSVTVLAAAWSLAIPDDASLFFHTAFKIMFAGLLWMCASFFVFAAAMITNIWRDLR